MESLGLLTELGGNGGHNIETRIAVIDSYFKGDGMTLGLTTDQQEQDIQRACKAAFEGR